MINSIIMRSWILVPILFLVLTGESYAAQDESLEYIETTFADRIKIFPLERREALKLAMATAYANFKDNKSFSLCCTKSDSQIRNAMLSDLDPCPPLTIKLEDTGAGFGCCFPWLCCVNPSEDFFFIPEKKRN